MCLCRVTITIEVDRPVKASFLHDGMVASLPSVSQLVISLVFYSLLISLYLERYQSRMENEKPLNNKS
jgi:hypothetical protein